MVEGSERKSISETFETVTTSNLLEIVRYQSDSGGGTAMINQTFALLYRLHRWLLTRRINYRFWDRDLSQSLACLDHLIMTFGGREHGGE